jgi:hypothetical protein
MRCSSVDPTLGAHLEGEPVGTRGFEEREGPLRDLNDADLWDALRDRMATLNDVAVAADKVPADTDVAWTGRTMKVPWFAEHMREELVLHGWDITGDRGVPTAFQAALAEPWRRRTASLRSDDRCWPKESSSCDRASGSRRDYEYPVPTTFCSRPRPTTPRSGSPSPTGRPHWKPMPPRGCCCCGVVAPPIRPGSAAASGPKLSADCGNCSAATERTAPLGLSSCYRRPRRSGSC